MNKANPTNLMRRGLRCCAGGKADRRGSAIVLVLVSIVLMALLAATLLQVTRFERIPRPVSNIDIVVESVVDEILNQATNDLLDNDGNMFNAEFIGGNNANGGGDEPWDFPWTNPGPLGQPAFGRTVESIYNGNQVNVLGGAFDDSWLASSAPDFRTSLPANSVRQVFANDIRGVWPKISNISGMYLGGQGGSRDLSTTTRGDGQPQEYPVNTTAPGLQTDMNVPIPAATDPNGPLVDADGDGVGDSRWEWAPIRQIGTTRYTMAVRIVDLSARMDVNVAIGQYDDTRNFNTDPTAAIGGNGLPFFARGDGPTELDGAGMVASHAAASGINTTTARNDWRNALGFRMTGNPAAVLGGVPGYDGNAENPLTRTRRDYWDHGASLVSPTFARNGESSTTSSFDYSANSTFGLVDAFELLNRNGLNNPNTTLLEDIMSVVLRRDAAEDSFLAGNTVTARNWNQRQFWENDIRKHLSPFTGAMSVRRPDGVISSLGTLQRTLQEPRQHRLDINEAVQSSGGLDDLEDVIFEVLSSGANANALLNRYPHFNGDRRKMARQLAVNLADYIDADNALTVRNDGTAGFEALPYITEVYTQRMYAALNVTPADPMAMPPTTLDTVTWVTPVNGQGYVIEIGNPYAQFDTATNQWVGRSVSLERIYIKIGNNSSVRLTDLPGIGATNRLDPGEVLLIRHDSTGAPTTANLDDLTNLYAAGDMTIVPAPDGIDVTGNVNFRWPANETEVRVELRAEAQIASDQITAPTNWAYSACEVEVSPERITEDVTPGTIMPGYLGYIRTDFQGIGEGLRMMTVTADPRSTNARGFDDEVSELGSPSSNAFPATAVPASLPTPISELAERDKSRNPSATGPFAGLNGLDQQVAWHDNPRNRLQWVGDILQIPLIGPDALAADDNDRLMAEAFHRANQGASPLSVGGDGVRALLLPYKTSTAANAGERADVINNNVQTNGSGLFGVLNVPHALILLEQLTTHSPATDGKDGDNADGDDNANTGGGSLNNPDEEELLVPGRINLNTASEETLIRLLPYPDLVTRRAIARAIIERRESLRQFTNHGIGADNIPGIAYTSSLYEHIQRQNTGGTGITTFTGNPAADNNSNTYRNGVRIDWTDEEATVGGFAPPAGLADGVIDDREEEIMLTKWLAEVADNRSDVFAAYIVVQGYPADDFTVGAIESARLIVIFSRANVEGAGDQAVEIGRFRFQ